MQKWCQYGFRIWSDTGHCKNIVTESGHCKNIVTESGWKLKEQYQKEKKNEVNKNREIWKMKSKGGKKRKKRRRKKTKKIEKLRKEKVEKKTLKKKLKNIEMITYPC